MRDLDWKQMSSVHGFVAMDCIHLGGSPDVSWSFDIEHIGGHQSKSKIDTIEAKGGDLYVHGFRDHFRILDTD